MTRQRFQTLRQSVESISVVDTLDVTRNRDVSLDCACSAEKVYCINILECVVNDHRNG